MYESEERLTISDLAREEGVDKALISRRVKKLEQQGLLPTYSGPNNSKLVNRSQYNQACGRPGKMAPLGDPISQMAYRGKLGREEVLTRRLEAARKYAELFRRADGGEQPAAQRMDELDSLLGIRGAELCYLILVKEKNLKEIDSSDRSHLLATFCDCLDLLAENFCFPTVRRWNSHIGLRSVDVSETDNPRLAALSRKRQHTRSARRLSEDRIERISQEIAYLTGNSPHAARLDSAILERVRERLGYVSIAMFNEAKAKALLSSGVDASNLSVSIALGLVRF